MLNGFVQMENTGGIRDILSFKQTQFRLISEKDSSVNKFSECCRIYKFIQRGDFSPPDDSRQSSSISILQ